MKRLTGFVATLEGSVDDKNLVIPSSSLSSPGASGLVMGPRSCLFGISRFPVLEFVHSDGSGGVLGIGLGSMVRANERDSCCSSAMETLIWRWSMMSASCSE